MQKLKKTVFVFGSNLAGRHGKGAARTAYLRHGAIYGRGVGPQGQAYAIPTKDYELNVLALEDIKDFVDQFILYAGKNQDTIFRVTAIGCGLAGYSPKDIAPMFKDSPSNCKLPIEFRDILKGIENE